MRNKQNIHPNIHPEVRRFQFLQSINKNMAKKFTSIAKFELFKAKARAAMASAPHENGYVFIPNNIMDDLLKSDFSAEQINDVLKIFDPRGEK